MNITLNDKIQIKDNHDLRKIYNFLYGYMQGIFETRYTCKIDMEDHYSYFIVSNFNDLYLISEYAKTDHVPLPNHPHAFLNLQDCLEYLLKEVKQ